MRRGMREQMKIDEIDEAANQPDARDANVGDVETAGETTAADTINSSPANQKPVGADTLVKVAEKPEPPEK